MNTFLIGLHSSSKCDTGKYKKAGVVKTWLNNYCYSRGMEVFVSKIEKYYSSTWHQNHHYLVMEWCMCLWFDKTLFVLACTPPPGLTTSHECPQSFPAHWLSHLAVGNGNVWTHMRTAPVTPKSETPSLLRRSARTSSQWWDYLECQILGIWCWKWHTTDQWAVPG